MSTTEEKENPWGYYPLNEVLSSVAPIVIGMILAIAGLIYVPMKKKSLQDIVKNISYSVTSVLILKLINASLLAYIALSVINITFYYLVAYNCNSAFDQSESCLGVSWLHKLGNVAFLIVIGLT